MASHESTLRLAWRHATKTSPNGTQAEWAGHSPGQLQAPAPSVAPRWAGATEVADQPGVLAAHSEPGLAESERTKKHAAYGRCIEETKTQAITATVRQSPPRA